VAGVDRIAHFSECVPDSVTFLHKMIDAIKKFRFPVK
jgi:hypothetical protein